MTRPQKVHHTLSALALIALCWAPSAAASIVNYQQTMSGRLFQAGNAVGTVTASLSYNLGDDGDNTKGSQDTSGADGFPDKMKVTCSGAACSAGARTAEYTPWPLYADEYAVSFRVLLDGSAPAFYNASIDQIDVLNNIERNFGEWRDVVTLHTSLGNITVANTFRPMSGSGVPEVSPLSGIFLDEALARLPMFFTDPAHEASGLLGFGGVGYGARFTAVGPLVAAVPEPGVLALLALAAGAGCVTRRRRS